LYDFNRVQHQLYLYLLQRYLRIKYGSECETKFSHILHILQDIHVLNELHKENYREIMSEKCGPLLREILDIPSDYGLEYQLIQS